MKKSPLNNKITTAAVSLLGDRTEQQDSMGFWSKGSVWLGVVADGAGGHVGGALASQIVIEEMDRLWNETDGNLMIREKNPSEILGKYLLGAHERIIKETGDGIVARGARSAAIVLYISGDKFYLVHVGDCRCYCLRKGESLWRTTDDSVLQLLINSGKVREEDRQSHPDQSKLTQALGSDCLPKPHFQEGAWEDASAFLLCCDGFWNPLNEREIISLSLTKKEHLNDCLHALAKQAVHAAAGNSDNVTAIGLLLDRSSKEIPSSSLWCKLTHFFRI